MRAPVNLFARYGLPESDAPVNPRSQQSKEEESDFWMEYLAHVSSKWERAKLREPVPVERRWTTAAAASITAESTEQEDAWASVNVDLMAENLVKMLEVSATSSKQAEELNLEKILELDPPQPKATKASAHPSRPVSTSPSKATCISTTTAKGVKLKLKFSASAPAAAPQPRPSSPEETSGSKRKHKKGTEEVAKKKRHHA